MYIIARRTAVVRSILDTVESYTGASDSLQYYEVRNSEVRFTVLRTSFCKLSIRWEVKRSTGLQGDLTTSPGRIEERFSGGVTVCISLFCSRLNTVVALGGHCSLLLPKVASVHGILSRT